MNTFFLLPLNTLLRIKSTHDESSAVIASPELLKVKCVLNSANGWLLSKCINQFWACASFYILCTAWKVFVFGVILVRIFPHSDWIRTRLTLNTNTFYAVLKPKGTREKYKPESGLKSRKRFRMFFIILNRLTWYMEIHGKYRKNDLQN